MLGVPFDARMMQRTSAWYGTACKLLECSDAQLKQRKADLAAAVGVSQQRAAAVALAHPRLLLPSVDMAQLGSLRQWLSAERLATMLENDSSPCAADHLATILHLWIDLVGLPAGTAVATSSASLQDVINRSWPLLRGGMRLRYADSTIRRRMAAIREVRLGAGAACPCAHVRVSPRGTDCGTHPQPAGWLMFACKPLLLTRSLASLPVQAVGMTEEEAAHLVFANPYLLRRQHTMVRSAGAWLAQHVPSHHMAALIQADLGLLSASEWRLRETVAKLALWTQVHLGASCGGQGGR